MVEPAALWLSVWVSGLRKGLGWFINRIRVKTQWWFGEGGQIPSRPTGGGQWDHCTWWSYDRSMSVSQQTWADSPEHPLHFFLKRRQQMDACVPPLAGAWSSPCPCLRQPSPRPRRVSCCPKSVCASCHVTVLSCLVNGHQMGWHRSANKEKEIVRKTKLNALGKKKVS